MTHHHHHHHPSKIELDPDPFFLHHHHNHFHHHNNHPPFSLSTTPTTTQTNNNNNNNNNARMHCASDCHTNNNNNHPSFSLLFHPPPSPPSSPETRPEPDPGPIPQPKINPQPHISTQFYTFNKESHNLMLTCLLQNRPPSPAEIRAVTPLEVLKSWRSVWKDRNEDTAYLTAWKRIQDKLNVHIDGDGNGDGDRYICFKNNCNQFVSDFSKWQEIVMRAHVDASRENGTHLGLKETVERVKQRWLVGAKFYGIPESFIRVCVAECGVCNGGGGGDGGGGGGVRSKRRRFEYTESFDVPAREVPSKLQMLAKKYCVVLCIRQKYIRYKPFMAEVKDYACHRAGEPGGGSKKLKVLKREPYASKRCGCGFRIRAIVPIRDYNEKDKSFVYEEEGVAVFKLYAVHTGHEPGPLDGNARIMHRVVGHNRVVLSDHETEYGVNEELENEGFVGRDEGEFGSSVLHQVQELKSEVGLLENRILKLPPEVLGSVSQELYHIVNKVRELGYETSKSVGLDSDKTNSDVMLVGDNDMPHWNDHGDDRLYGDGKDNDLIEEDDDSFGRTLGDVVPWDQMRADCRSDKDMIDESCKPDKWLNTSDFDEKSILVCDDSKLTKPLRHDSLEEDVGLVALQVDSFYPENPKWYDSPCGLDSSTDCGHSDFRHGEIM